MVRYIREERNYPGLEMKMAVQRKALDIVHWLDKEELNREGGVKILLQELEKQY